MSPHDRRWLGASGLWHPASWNWQLGAIIASLANLVLLIVLVLAFPRRHSGEIVVCMTVLCTVAMMVVGMMSWTIV